MTSMWRRVATAAALAAGTSMLGWSLQSQARGGDGAAASNDIRDKGGYAQLIVSTSYGQAKKAGDGSATPIDLSKCPRGKTYDRQLDEFLNRDQTVNVGVSFQVPNPANGQVAKVDLMPVDIKVKKPFLGEAKCNSKILPEQYLTPLYVMNGANFKLGFTIAPLLTVRAKPSDDFIKLTSDAVTAAFKYSTITAPYAAATGGLVNSSLSNYGENKSNAVGAVVSVDPERGPLEQSWTLPKAQFGGTDDIVISARIVRVASIFDQRDVAITPAILPNKDPTWILGTRYDPDSNSAASNVEGLANHLAPDAMKGLTKDHNTVDNLNSDCSGVQKALSADGVSELDTSIILWAIVHAYLPQRWGGYLPDGSALDSLSCISLHTTSLKAVGITLHTDKKPEEPKQPDKPPVTLTAPTTEQMRRTINNVIGEDGHTDLYSFAQGGQGAADFDVFNGAAGRLFVDQPEIVDPDGLAFRASGVLQSNGFWSTPQANYAAGAPFFAKLGCYSYLDLAQVPGLGASAMVAIGKTPGGEGRPAASANREVVVEFIFAPAPKDGPARIQKVIVRKDFDPSVKATILKLQASGVCGAGDNRWSPELLKQ